MRTRPQRRTGQSTAGYRKTHFPPGSLPAVQKEVLETLQLVFHGLDAERVRGFFSRVQSLYTGVVAALLHDAGYIQEASDRRGY
jgi:hypothetical protein